MYVERMMTDRLRKLAATFPVIAITGARQVGKSTLLQHVFPHHQSVVFDPIIDVENARHDPDLFLDNRRPPLILDEIQYVPQLINVLKRRVDRDRTPGQYLITGSQQWSVMRSLSESLAGRVVFLDLHGFALAELASENMSGRSWLARWLNDPADVLRTHLPRLPADRTLYEHLWRGWLPEAQFLPAETLADFHIAYRRTYIERDAKFMADVSDWELFGRFFQLAAALTAQEVNFSHLGRELGITPQTSRRWLDILKATFQWFEVPAYSGNAVKRVSAKPKGYLADSGIACAALAISSPTAVGGHPLWGTLFETMVIGEIRKHGGLLSPPPTCYHWRSHGGAEVDLILERDGTFFPIEVKAGSRPDRHDASGILAFRKTYPRLRTAPGLIIAPAETLYPVADNVHVLPWDSR